MQKTKQCVGEAAVCGTRLQFAGNAAVCGRGCDVRRGLIVWARPRCVGGIAPAERCRACAPCEHLWESIQPVRGVRDVPGTELDTVAERSSVLGT